MFDRAILSFEGAPRIVAAVGVLELLKALLLCGQAYSLALVIVNVWEGHSIIDQVGLIACFAFCFIVVQLVRNSENELMDAFAMRSSAQLRSNFLQVIAIIGPVGITSYGAAALSAQVVEGIQNVTDYLRLMIPKMMGVIIVPLVILITLFFLDWVSGVIALVCYPFILIFMVLIGSSAKAEADKRRLQFDRMSNSFIDTAQGIDTIKAFGAVSAFRESILRNSERFRKLTMRTLRVALLSSTVLDIFSTLALAAVAIMLGFRLVDGTIMFLPALTVLLLVPDYFKPIKDFGSDYHASLEGRTSFEMIRSIIEAASRIPAVIEDGKHCSCDELEICVDDLAFAYDETQLVWNDLNLHVHKPCKVGILGPSGQGKTTFLNILAGFCAPQKGLVYVNDTPFETLKRTSWLDRVAYIPQAPTIYTATLRENLVLYDPSADDAQVCEAISAVGLDELLNELPDGLDTVIGRGGRTLSGGELQRVALARAVLAPERDVWVLDEPTAHLDIQTECELKERMLPLMEDKLVFLATHRLHWSESMDVVVDLSEHVPMKSSLGEGGEMLA